MDLALAFNIAMSIIALLGGWLLKTLFQRLDRAEETNRKLFEVIGELRTQLAERYASKEEVRAYLNPIHDALRRIEDGMTKALQRVEDKLDRKVDKG